MMHRKTAVLLLLALAFLVCGGLDISAQCVMCKAVAEDSARDGSIGRGLNRGIVYIMVVPYILLATIGWFIWKRREALQ
jgi:amino acid transporter